MPPRTINDPTRFHSILFDDVSATMTGVEQEAPEFFTDLNLDQVVESITAGRDEYNLKPFFYAPLSRCDAVYYRHDVLRDLENESLFEIIQLFAKQMRTMRDHLSRADKSYYKYQKQAWFLDAANIYCQAVTRLNRDLILADLHSHGFLSFREYLMSYEKSADFISLSSETRTLKNDLSEIRYSLYIQGSRIKIGQYDPAPDYGADVLRTFEKFQQGEAKEYQFDFPPGPEMNHVEAAILDLVAQLYREIFSTLDEYCVRRSDYIDSKLAAFDREVQFYAAYLEYVKRFKQVGLSFCYSEVSTQSKEINASETFDLALADRLVRENAPVVTNDLYLRNPERIFVVSGPNQGGKTTFARTFGQLHYLARLGCPVPGREARLFLCDNLFTHFEREEDIRSLSGKLEDDLIRIHQMVKRATSSSILIMNESFLSTTLTDALFLSKEIMRQVIEIGMLCVSVTFLDELATLDETIVSMVSTVDPDDLARRTFKLTRKPADGLAYAAAIAEKYHLQYSNIKQRIGENAGYLVS